MDWQFPRSSYSVGLMCSAAVEYGLSLEQSLAGSGIDPSALNDQAAEIYPEQELAVIANIVRHLDQVPAIGLMMGSRIHMSVYGVLAFALSSCATGREWCKWLSPGEAMKRLGARAIARRGSGLRRGLNSPS